MKKFFFIVLMLFSVVTLSAQVDGDGAGAAGGKGRPAGQMRKMFSPEQMAQMETDAIHKAVGLDSLQYQLVYILKYSDAVAMQDSIKVRAERRERLRAEGGNVAPQRGNQKNVEGWVKAREEVMKKRRDAMNEQMKQILSPKQFRKYLKFEKEREAQRRQWGGRRGR